jgi:hypothetical protein
VPGQPGWSLTSIYLHVEANAGGGKDLQLNSSVVAGLHARADGSCPPTLLPRRYLAAS